MARLFFGGSDHRTHYHDCYPAHHLGIRESCFYPIARWNRSRSYRRNHARDEPHSRRTRGHGSAAALVGSSFTRRSQRCCESQTVGCGRARDCHGSEASTLASPTLSFEGHHPYRPGESFGRKTPPHHGARARRIGYPFAPLGRSGATTVVRIKIPGPILIFFTGVVKAFALSKRQ